jgi:YidC/Oxa1 family membrane protein insertase
VLNFFYTLIIFPIEQIVELCYVFAFRILRSPGLSIFGLSVAVSTLILPLYLMAEKQQQLEREKQKQMKRMGDNIKAVFKGDKRHLMLSTLYRQHNYHPVYALRGSLDLFIQIPFFIAAYHFISNLQLLNGQKFKFISDLGAPDGLLWGLNLLPIIMTLINIVSGAIYTKNLPRKDKIQVYGITALFLLLLYNSPAALVLYWTGNNLYNLVKNYIVHRTKNPKFIILSIVSIFCFVYILIFYQGRIIERVILACFLSAIPLMPYLRKAYAKIKQAAFYTKRNLKKVDDTSIFILSMAVLFLLGGFFVPSALIASSVQEFSFIENYESPFPFIANTALQSLGIFLLWPLCIYFMLAPKIKEILAKTAAVLAGIAIVDVFLFPGKYGFISLMFIFSNIPDSNWVTNFLNFLVICIVLVLILFFIRHFKKITLSALTIVACALVTVGTINCIKIFNEFKPFQLRYKENIVVIDEPVYQFSKTGKNVLIIMLDRAISGYIPYIFEEKPKLYDSFDGFTWYKNTITFGTKTVFGAPGIFGGYEYTPLEMQARDNIPLVEKHNESLLMLPKIFLDHGFKVIVTDPPYANYSWNPDLSIFDAYPQIHAKNIIGRYNGELLLDPLNDSVLKIGTDAKGIIKSYLIRFSFFKIVPLFLKNYVYDNEKWLSTKYKNEETYINFPLITFNNYTALDILPDITQISEEPFNAYTALVNNLTHEAFLLQAPDYIPSNVITNIGNGPFAAEALYHANMAAMLLLGKWFDFLKENNVYDNIRIIIVSDHGFPFYSEYPDNIILPDGLCLQAYAVPLLVKDFNSTGVLSINDTFMTNADVPLIALDGIVESPVNPWTGKLLTNDKENGIILATPDPWVIHRHSINVFDIKPDQWMHVHTNIFDPENWSLVQR